VVAAGAPGTLAIEATDFDGGGWKGTLAAMKHEVCDQAEVVATQWIEKNMGPFKKAGLKNDKYKYIYDEYPDGYYLPGAGSATTDPKQLAKANVWFLVTEDGACDGGNTQYTYFRYQFDKDQKLAKQSSRTYCGDPGLKALK
jgi:hypothetical protein